MDGWDVLERGRRAGPPRRGVRAGDRGLAAGPVVGPAGLAGRSSPPAGELHGWIGGACAEPVGDPRGPAGDRRGRRPGCCCSGTTGAVRRGGAGRDDRGADLLPERGRAGGLHRAGAARAAPGGRRPLADGARRWPSWPGRSAGAPTLVRRPGLLRGRRGRALHGRGRHPGPRRRGGGRAGGRGPARLPGPGRPRARAGRPCSATSPTGACRRTSSTGSGSRPAWTSGRHRTRRSRSRSWPSWSSCGPPARWRLQAGAAAQVRAAGGQRPGCARPARPGLRDDRDGGRVQPSRASTRALPTTSAAPAAARSSRRTPRPT